MPESAFSLHALWLGNCRADYLRLEKFFNFFQEIVPKKGIRMMTDHFSEAV